VTMIRKQIYVEPEQDSLLKRLVQETGQSEAELIRQAIDRQLRMVPGSRRDLKAWEHERAFVQRLIEQPAAPLPRHWTRDELYAR
jgi:hypothetical protein